MASPLHSFMHQMTLLTTSVLLCFQILDPIYPGKEFPLPLHLAEAGRMRWRPLGNFYLWSEAYNLSTILSQENKSGFLKSFVCYPSHPSSDPFRCCIAVQSISLPSSSRPRKGSFQISETLKEPYAHTVNDLDKSSYRFAHQVTLSTPLVINNYLPEAVSLKIESAGLTRTVLLSEVSVSLKLLIILKVSYFGINLVFKVMALIDVDFARWSLPFITLTPHKTLNWRSI